MPARVLVLNELLEPLHICDWQRAATLVYKGKATIREHTGGQLSDGIPFPSVIVLSGQLRVPFMSVSLSRSNVLHRDAYTCQYCGVRRNNLTLDHVLPRCRGGADSWENLVAACHACNERKGDRLPSEAGMPLAKQPTRPGNRLAFEVSKHSRRKYGTHWSKYLTNRS